MKFLVFILLLFTSTICVADLAYDADPLTGAGAPATTPDYEGQLYIDTTSDNVYGAAGTASSADWQLLDDGAGAGSLPSGSIGDYVINNDGASGYASQSGAATFTDLYSEIDTHVVYCDNDAGDITHLQDAEALADNSEGATILIYGKCSLNATWTIDAHRVRLKGATNKGVTLTATHTNDVIVFEDNDTGTFSGDDTTDISIEDLSIVCDSSNAGQNAIRWSNGGTQGFNTQWSKSWVKRVGFQGCAGYAITVDEDVYGDTHVWHQIGMFNMGGFVELTDTSANSFDNVNTSQFVADSVVFGGTIPSASTEEWVMDIGAGRAMNFRSLVLQGAGDATNQYKAYIRVGGNQGEPNFFENLHCEIVSNEPPFVIYFGDDNLNGENQHALIADGVRCKGTPISMGPHPALINISQWEYFRDADDAGVVSSLQLIDETRVTSETDVSYGDIEVLMSANSGIEIHNSQKGRYNWVLNYSEDTRVEVPANQPLISFDGTTLLDHNTSGATNSLENEYALLVHPTEVDLSTAGIFDDADVGRVYGVSGTTGNVARTRMVVSLPDDSQTDTITCDAVNDEIDATSHPFSDGERVIFSSTGTICAGIATNRYYYIFNSTANTFQISECYNNVCGDANALVDITGTGSGTHTADVHHSHFMAQLYMVGQIKVTSTGTNGSFDPFWLDATDGNRKERNGGVVLFNAADTADWRIGGITLVLDNTPATGATLWEVKEVASIVSDVATVYIRSLEGGFGNKYWMDRSMVKTSSTSQPLNIGYCTAAPTSGDYIDGDICWNRSAAVGSPPFWMVTTGGSPGTWTAAPNL